MKIDEKLVGEVIDNYCEVGKVALENFTYSEKEQIYKIATDYYGLSFKRRK